MAGKMTKDQIAALEADGEKLRQMTGEDHGPYFIDLYAPCVMCGGDGEQCEACGGSGWVERCQPQRGNR